MENEKTILSKGTTDLGVLFDDISVKIKLIYFTIVNVGTKENGGALCCRNHIMRLQADPEIDLFVVIASDPGDENNITSFLRDHKIAGKFVGFKNPSDVARKNFVKKFVSLPFEEYAEHQYHVDRAVLDAIQTTGAKLLVIDFLPSIFFCSKSLKTVSKKVLITLNRETEMYRDILSKTQMTLIGRAINLLKIARMRYFEWSTFQRVDKIIALSPPDVPARKGMYITSYFDKKAQQWKPNSSRTIFFVGNINHYPNAEAISYIITKLAPHVVRLLPDVRFKIIGASNDDVAFNHPAVDLLGKSNMSEVEYHFLHCQLFICPIKNTFGIKFKMTEALSYGTPILASPESLLGFPYIKNQPSLSLDNPIHAARTIVSIIQDEINTTSLAMNIGAQHCQFIESQRNVWSRALRQVLVRAAPS